ncbi:MAG: hypothetical protein O3A20_04280 [Planctomycetota bacterium]|nr:hypothetical protein [Planctomycetota bacterium]
MAKRKEFLVRLDPRVHDALRRWADEDLRSLNAQIEFLLREAMKRTRRLSEAETPGQAGEQEPEQ